MITKFIEATNGPQNWGKFLVARFTEEEFQYQSTVQTIPGRGWPLLRSIGWAPNHVWVLDLQTCEGAGFAPAPGHSPVYDLEKHQVWVCPMFEPFLEWLYQQDLTDLSKLPALVDLPKAPFAMAGYRRKGKRG